ncbi:AsmA family protein [Bosea psychrotolerans]|uniref:Uncharacterized protein involved in outer membrane biogenesis n=1 Tax=Bosea psychrotolerans TaxID=1871628 RepID=A0A2S4MQI0_9HYPH|nr:AsmA family protein [Bosea psychrotolerans]POR57016.1 uncharacterized protein involved in outer membrane biogenesis [Bosea psychrotolerans]
MRETLTVLAGLLVLALLAALIGPGFVDWRGYRPQIEARLSSVLGVETRVAGGIGLRLLPSPRLTLGDVRVGGAPDAASSVAVEQLTVELALSALVRGDFRFADAQAEGATLSIVVDEAGAIRLPASAGGGLPAHTSLDKLSIRRSALIWRDAGKAPVTLMPVAAEVSAVSLAGPWRIEGEVAGSSLRITTGAIEPDGRLRAKASITGDAIQIGFDGNFLLPAVQDGVSAGLEGAFTLAPGGALSLAGRVSGGSKQLDLAGLVLDIGGGAARLEGEGQFFPAGGTGSLALRARRLDLDALTKALSERAGFEHALHALPGPFDISLDLDQLIWRGEDFSAFGLRGRLDEGGLSGAAASVRVAGALVGATGAADAKGIAGRLNLKAEDSRRVALVLARAGLDPALADLVAGLGQIDAEAVGAWDGGRVAFERLLVTGSSGLRLEGSGDIVAERLAAKLALNGLDLNMLPPAESLAGLVGGRDLALDLALSNARFRNAPAGSASLDLRRDGAVWRLSRLAIEGFGGVAVTGSGALLAEGGEISGRIRAPRFETLAALAGPLLPDVARQALARAGDGLSRLDASFRLTRSAGGETGIAAEGMAQAGALALDGRIDPSGAWRKAGLRFDMSDRRQVFAALGLPAPQLGGPGRFTLEQQPGRLMGSLAGPGLSLVLEGEGGNAARLSLQADRPGQILPEGPARLMPDGLFDASGRVGFTADGVALDDLVANLGGVNAKGALVLARDGGLSGRLSLPGLDLRALLGGALGASPAPPGSTWSTVRFGPVVGLGDLKLAIEATSLVASDAVMLRDARFTLQADRDGASIEDLSGAYGGGTLSGRVALRREGGLAQLSGRIGLTQLDLAALTHGALGGKLSGQVEAGGSGESPARLIAGLGGTGSVTLIGASLSRFDPAAYARVIAATGEDASESETARLQGRLGEALDSGAWALGDVTLPFTLAGGLARLQPFSFERSGLRAEATGLIDLRALSADLRLGLRPLGGLPKGWPSDAPQIGVAWRGPLSALQRETDVGALSNAVAARALAREIERVEAFEADARERAANSRRLRAEREMRENERKLNEFIKAEEERKLAEEKRAEEAKRLEELRRLAEEKKAEDSKRAEQARQEQEARGRSEAEERARAAAARGASQPQQPGPLVLPGAPRASFPEPDLQPARPGGSVPPPLPPPMAIESVPRPLSRSVQPN